MSKSVSMTLQLRRLEVQYADALAAGDRRAALGIFHRVRELLKNADPQKLQAWIELLGGLLGAGMHQPAEAQTLGASACLSEGEVTAAGLFDNPQLWIQLVTLLFELFRQIRLGDTDGTAAPSPSAG